MQQKFTELRCKEVINVSDGCRLGYVSDVVVEMPMGHLTAIVVPGPSRLWGLLRRECDYFIPWHCIKRIGDDIILIDVILAQVCFPREKNGWFG